MHPDIATALWLAGAAAAIALFSFSLGAILGYDQGVRDRETK